MFRRIRNASRAVWFHRRNDVLECQGSRQRKDQAEFIPPRVAFQLRCSAERERDRGDTLHWQNLPIDCRAGNVRCVKAGQSFSSTPCL